MIRRFFAIAMLCLIFVSGAWAQSAPVTLKYKFTVGETLRYKTESHDSLVSNMGGAMNTMKMTRHSINSLQVQKTPPDGAYKIQVKMDTTWMDESADRPEMSMGGGRDRRPGGNMSRESQDIFLEMDEWGGSTGRDAVVSPFIIPLPKAPVKVNDTWNFELTQPMRGRATGETQIKGQCLLYEVTPENVALIIVNTETQSNSQFKGNFNGQEFSMTNNSTGVGTLLVYFDITQGRITEVVNESTTETASEGTRSGNNTRSSKTTIRLMTP